MKDKEVFVIIIAILVLAIVIGAEQTFIITSDQKISFDPSFIGTAIFFAFLIIISNVLAKKVVAYNLDSSVELEIWKWWRFSMKPGWHLRKKIPMGVILPLFFTIFTIGFMKLMTIMSYETKALTRRAARRFGYYSYAEMTEWHNSLVATGGMLAVLLLAFVSYWIPGLEGLPKMATYFVVWNLIPFSKLDGAQMFIGSRLVWYEVVILALIFLGYSIFLV